MTGMSIELGPYSMIQEGRTIIGGFPGSVGRPLRSPPRGRRDTMFAYPGCMTSWGRGSLPGMNELAHEGHVSGAPTTATRQQMRFRLISVALISVAFTALAMYIAMRPPASGPVGTMAASAVSDTPQPSISLASPVAVSSSPPAAVSSSPPAVPTPIPTASEAASQGLGAIGSVESVMTTSPSAAAPIPELEQGWVTTDVLLSTPDDVWRLENAPEGFRESVSLEVGVPDEDGCTPQVSIFAMHEEGFVYGSVGYPDCGGGAQALWGNQSGTWEALLVFQDVPDCEDVVAAGVPENMGALECFSDGQTWYY